MSEDLATYVAKFVSAHERGLVTNPEAVRNCYDFIHRENMDRAQFIEEAHAPTWLIDGLNDFIARLPTSDFTYVPWLIGPGYPPGSQKAADYQARSRLIWQKWFPEQVPIRRR